MSSSSPLAQFPQQRLGRRLEPLQPSTVPSLPLAGHLLEAPLFSTPGSQPSPPASPSSTKLVGGSCRSNGFLCGSQPETLLHRGRRLPSDAGSCWHSAAHSELYLSRCWR